MYKVSISKDQQLLKHFYIDYRSSDLIENFNSGTNLNGDIFLDYDKNTNKLYYEGTQTEFHYFTTIWDEKYWINHTTTYLTDFWGNCLTSLPIGGGHPMIYWGRHPLDDVEFEVDNYKIYRAVSSG